MTAERPDFDALVPAMPAEMLADPEAWDRRIVEQREREQKKQLESRASLREPLLLTCGFPGKAIKLAVHGFQPTAASLALAANGGPPTRSGSTTIVVLSGGVGSGKTVAATRWVAENDDRSPLFVRAAAFEASSRYDKKWRERWTKASSLVLDDLGAEYGDAAQHFLTGLDELLDVAYSQPIPTIITTNMPAAAFAERYGNRIASRLRECARWRNVQGPDLRRNQ